MANPLNEMKHTRLEAVITRLSENGMTDVHGEAILKDPEGLVCAIVAALNAMLGLAKNIGRPLGTVSLKPQSPDETIATLEADGFRVSDWAKDVIRRMPAVVAQDVDLVVVTVAELGFTKAARFDKICARAKSEFGLELCPAGVGPALRRALKGQPMGEWLVVAMEPVTGSDGDPFVFCVERYSGGLWLYTRYGFADYQYDLVARFVFVCGK